jgi:hypothetical protein
VARLKKNGYVLVPYRTAYFSFPANTVMNIILMKPYNIPEFSTRKVPVAGYTVAQKGRYNRGTDLTFLLK